MKRSSERVLLGRILSEDGQKDHKGDKRLNNREGFNSLYNVAKTNVGRFLASKNVQQIDKKVCKMETRRCW